MSKGVNRIHLIGNVGKDPEMFAAASGTKVATISLATTDGWGENEKTNWHMLKAFGKLADVVEQYVKQGDRIYVEGRADYSISEKDGVTRYWTSIIVDDLVMLGGGREKKDYPLGHDDSAMAF